tara:strand:+ start:626 stop:1063 length:438 start_codon:yes stop_codon:yes gene_type:complete
MSKALPSNIHFDGEFFFEYQIQIKETDMYMGIHLSNDKALAFITEMHGAYLKSKDMAFDNVAGFGLFFKTSFVKYMKEVIYPETLTLRIGIHEVDCFRICFYHENLNSKGEVCQKALIECVYVDKEKRKPVTADKALSAYQGILE